MKLANGKKLGSYEILALAGAGGMGEVYRARDTRLGREVAVKVLPEALASDPDRLVRFEREARTVAVLNHPNIVMLHSIEEAEGIRFLTMELVEGKSLDRLIVPGGLPLDRVLDIAIPLADALVAAHERGVVHRDLKPANVMITKEGRIKVLDFGLAKQASAVLTRTEAADAETQALKRETPLSLAGQVMGTAQYMAPEQCRGEAVDARTDLFALGIIIYELATGRRPFRGTSSADISSAILRDAPEPLQSLRADAPGDLQRIVSRCLEKDRDRRFQTAKDVRNELELVRQALGPAPSSPSRSTRPQSAVPAQDVPSIAILPFVNRSRDEDDEYFSDGLADELLNLLAKIRGLRVAARTSSYLFKGKNEDIAVIGQKLNVATLLEGSVRKAGNRIRIAVQLVKVSDGFHLWSETYDRTMDDIFELQDDIAQSVVKELRTTLMGEDPDSKASGDAKAAVRQAAKGRGEDSEAYRLFLQGRYFLERFTRDEVAKGVQYLRQAIELDSEFALAWAELSRALNFQAGYSWIPFAAGYEQARAAALRAIELEPDLAEGHVALGTVLSNYFWEWKAAEESYRRALEISPSHATAMRGEANLALAFGRIDHALDLFRRVVMQDPLSAAAYHSYGTACRFAGLHDEALAAHRKALELNPQRVITHLLLGLGLYAQGRLEESLAAMEKEPEPFARLCGLAVTLHALGQHEKSDAALAQLIEEFGHNAGYQIAAVYADRGNVEAAFEWLERSYAGRDPGLMFVKAEPTFLQLHGDPRWIPFLKKMRLAD